MFSQHLRLRAANTSLTQVEGQTLASPRPMKQLYAMDCTSLVLTRSSSTWCLSTDTPTVFLSRYKEISDTSLFVRSLP